MIMFFCYLYQNNLASFFNFYNNTSTFSTIAPPFLIAGASVFYTYSDPCNFPNLSKAIVSKGFDFA